MPIAICTTKANEQHYEVHSDKPNASAHFHPFFWGKGLNCSLYSLSWSPKSSNWTDMIRREEALQQHAMHCFVLIQLLFELWRLDIKCNRWIWPSPRNEVLKAVDCGLIQTTIFTICGHRSFSIAPCIYNWPNVLFGSRVVLHVRCSGWCPILLIWLMFLFLFLFHLRYVINLFDKI